MKVATKQVWVCRVLLFLSPPKEILYANDP